MPTNKDVDHEKPPIYIGVVEGGMIVTMSDTDITKLENRIDELIKICDQLKDENSLLRERHSLLTEERARLIEKADMARTRVEGILTRLRAMEQT